MSLFTCPKCGAKFDVSSLQPGSTFVCGSCKNVLQVPRRPVAPPVPPAFSPPGRSAPTRPAGAGSSGFRSKPARAGAPKTDPRRAGAAAPPPAAPAPPGRPGRSGGARRSRVASRPPREKSNLPIILGSVGGLLVIVVVVLIFALGGDDKPKRPAGGGNTNVANQGTGNPGGSGGGTPTEPNKRENLKNRLLASQSENQFKEVYDEAEAAGYGDIAKKAATAARQLNHESEWANIAAGYKDLTEIYSQIPNDPSLSHLTTKEWDDLLFESEGGPKWGTSERYTELKGMLDRVKQHVNKLKNDRSYKDLFRVQKLVEKHPAYSQFKYTTYFQPGNPYIVFSEYDESKGPGVAKRAQEIVERDAVLLDTLYKNFHMVFGEKFDLPDVSELEREGMRTLKVFTFFNKESFDKYQQLIGQQLPPGAAAYYFPTDQWVTLFEAPGGETFRDGQANFNLNKVMHEGAHQLVHLYTKVLMERASGEEVFWSDPRTHSKCHWFQEGTAEFFAPAKKKPDGSWEGLIPYKYRIDEWKMTRARKFSEWSFDEIRSIHSGPELQRRSAQKGLGQQVRLASLFYAEAWSFVHFLYFFENGKYRSKYQEYAEKEFSGVSGPDVFEKLWFGDAKVDWSTVEKEWKGYVDDLLK